MKAVVLEIKNGYAAVLREDGIVVKIKRPCAVGDTIEVTEKDDFTVRTIRFRKIVRGVAIAAAVVFVLSLGIGGYYYTTDAASSVVVDAGGAKVTLYLNHFSRVIDISAEEEDTETTLAEELRESGIRNKTLNEALETIDAAFQGKGYPSVNDEMEIRIQTNNQSTFEQLQNQAKEFGVHIEQMEQLTPQNNTDMQMQTQPATAQNPITQETSASQKQPELPETSAAQNQSSRQEIQEPQEPQGPQSQPFEQEAATTPSGTTQQEPENLSLQTTQPDSADMPSQPELPEQQGQENVPGTPSGTDQPMGDSSGGPAEGVMNSAGPGDSGSGPMR